MDSISVGEPYLGNDGTTTYIDIEVYPGEGLMPVLPFLSKGDIYEDADAVGYLVVEAVMSKISGGFGRPDFFSWRYQTVRHV